MISMVAVGVEDVVLQDQEEQRSHLEIAPR
jgi:hypothetical protein